MATFVMFQDFAEQLGKGTHQLHAAGHTLKVYLSNAVPSASADAVKADLAEITAANGYTAGGEDIQNDFTESGGTGTLTGVDVEWTAGAEIGPFQHAVIVNDSTASKNLVGYWSDDAPVTLAVGEKYKVDFGAAILTIGPAA